MGRGTKTSVQRSRTADCDGTVVTYYNPKKEPTVLCNQSDKGLGAAFLQDRQPLSFVSTALTPKKCRHAQIEKEMLAVVNVLNIFHQYTFERHTRIITDH